MSKAGPNESAESQQRVASADSVSGSASLASGGSALMAEGWFAALGLEILQASAAEVRAKWTVGKQHLQPHGVVHGGVHCSVVETCCSIGAQLAVAAGNVVVGVENHTSFVRSVGEGTTLWAHAAPLHVGRRAQLWECAIRDDGERLIASGRLRLMSIGA